MKIKRSLGILFIGLVGAFILPSSASAFNIEDHVPALKAGAFAQSHWPEEWAGWWVGDLNHPSPNALADDTPVHFAFTEDAVDKVAMLREKYPSVQPYAAHGFEFSFDHLNTLAGQVSKSLYTILQEKDPSSLDFNSVLYAAGIQPYGNRVNVDINPPPGESAFRDWLKSSDFDTWKAQWPPEVVFPDHSEGSYPAPIPDYIFPANSTLVFDPPIPGRDSYGNLLEPETTKKPAKARDSRRTTAKRKHRLRAKHKLMRKNRRQVRKCGKARRSGSAKHRKFSKSKKCRKARVHLRKAQAKHA